MVDNMFALAVIVVEYCKNCVISVAFKGGYFLHLFTAFLFYIDGAWFADA